MSARRVIGLGALFVACVSAACIIGPKQDDPAEDRGILDDGGLTLDSAFGGNGDTSTSGVDAPAVPEDAASSGDTSTPTLTDAVGDTADEAGDAGDAAEAGDASDAAEGG